MDRNEDDLLKSVALQNAQSILAARTQAERELIQSKEALARRADELAEEREWFRIVLSSIGDAVITTDVKGKVTFLNPQAELLTGWSSSEALGQSLESVFPCESLEAANAWLHGKTPAAGASVRSGYLTYCKLARLSGDRN